MRVVIAKCSVDYAGRLTAHLPTADRVLMIKADGSVLVHSDGGSYKPLNWMTPPCTLSVAEPDADQREAGRRAKGHIFNLGHGVIPSTDPGQLTALTEFVHGCQPRSA